MPTKRQRKPSQELTKILADNLRQIRKSKGLSQEELADLCDLHRTFVGSVERSERNVTLSTLEAFSKALEIEVTDLLTERTSDDDL